MRFHVDAASATTSTCTCTCACTCIWTYINSDRPYFATRHTELFRLLIGSNRTWSQTWLDYKNKRDSTLITNVTRLWQKTWLATTYLYVFQISTSVSMQTSVIMTSTRRAWTRWAASAATVTHHPTTSFSLTLTSTAARCHRMTETQVQCRASSQLSTDEFAFTVCAH